MAERKMADALDELYNDGVKAKMKDFIIENIDTIVAQLAGKYLTQSDAQSQFASINSALSGKLGTTAKAASATTADSASKVTGGTIQLTGSVTGSGSFNSSGNVNITTSGGGSNISLLSSTGSSTTAGMTQAAITNELNNKLGTSNEIEGAYGSTTKGISQWGLKKLLDQKISWADSSYNINNPNANFAVGTGSTWGIKNVGTFLVITNDTNGGVYGRQQLAFGGGYIFTRSLPLSGEATDTWHQVYPAT